MYTQIYYKEPKVIVVLALYGNDMRQEEVTAAKNNAIKVLEMRYKKCKQQ